MDHLNWYIDVDGTLTDARSREVLAESQGLVTGAYGSSEREFPKGKKAFQRFFGDPRRYHTDTTIEGALTLLNTLHEETTGSVTILTARQDNHALATQNDLRARGLWFAEMALVCKPRSWASSSASFKSEMIESAGLGVEGGIVFVDNNPNNRVAVASAVESHCFSSCEEALSWYLDESKKGLEGAI